MNSATEFRKWWKGDNSMKRILLFFCILGIATSGFGFETLVFTGGNPAGSPYRWGTSQIPVGYSIHSGGTAGVSASSVGSQFNKVIGIINNQSPLKFKNLGTTSSVNSGDRL